VLYKKLLLLLFFIPSIDDKCFSEEIDDTHSSHKHLAPITAWSLYADPFSDPEDVYDSYALLLLSGDRDGGVLLFDGTTGRVLRDYREIIKNEPEFIRKENYTESGIPKVVRSLRFSRDKRYFAYSVAVEDTARACIFFIRETLTGKLVGRWECECLHKEQGILSFDFCFERDRNNVLEVYAILDGSTIREFLMIDDDSWQKLTDDSGRYNLYYTSNGVGLFCNLKKITDSSNLFTPYGSGIFPCNMPSAVGNNKKDISDELGFYIKENALMSFAREERNRKGYADSPQFSSLDSHPRFISIMKDVQIPSNWEETDSLGSLHKAKKFRFASPRYLKHTKIKVK
jgi:hypothetical protein